MTSINPPISILPDEILSMVLRSATLDEMSIQTTYQDPGELATYRFDEFQRSQEAFVTKYSISLVCKQWESMNGPFLCEYVYQSSSDRKTLDSLARSLDRESYWNSKRKRGSWTKRVDICFNDFECDWHTLEDDSEYSDASGQSRWYGWQHILSLTPNVAIVNLFDGPYWRPSDWTSQVFFTLSTLKQLRRIDWQAEVSDMSDLQQLSALCPSLTHLAFNLTAAGGGDMDASTDAFEISFPHIQTLLLKWDQTEFPFHIYPPFQPWQLPALRHLTFFLRQYSTFRMAKELVSGVGQHLISLELPVLGKNVLVTLPLDFFNMVPVLEMLILDVFKTRITGNSSHEKLRVIGLRLRMGCSLSDVADLQNFISIFNVTNFPAMEYARIVHPSLFSDYAHGFTRPLLEQWQSMVRRDNGWVPIVTFDGAPLLPEDFQDLEVLAEPTHSDFLSVGDLFQL